MPVQILQNAPVWVWPLLIVLLVVGLLQTPDRMLYWPVVLVLPIVLLALSLYGIQSSFGLNIGAFGAWLVGAAAATVLNVFVFRIPRGVRYHVETERFEVPGSFVPLALIMVIFISRFVVGATIVRAPSIAVTPEFVCGASLLLGLASGLFMARAAHTLATARRPASP